MQKTIKDRLLKLFRFRRGSQNWNIVNHILTYGSITNHKMHSKYHICNHTPRVTEIRAVLLVFGYFIIATQVGKTNTYVYTIILPGGTI